MARNVVIMIGKEETTFNGINKIITDNTGGGSDTWVAEADVAEKEITENGTYNAEDDDVTGYSKVTVNVEGGAGSLVTKEITENGRYEAQQEGAYGYSTVNVNVEGTGGGPTPIEEVEAVALEDLEAGDCIYVNAAGGTSEEVTSVFTGNNGTNVAYDYRGKNVYYRIGGETNIYKISLDDMESGTPALHKDGVTASTVRFCRNIMVYSRNNLYNFENALDNEVISASRSSTTDYRSYPFKGTSDYFNCPLYDDAAGWLEYSDFSSKPAVNSDAIRTKIFGDGTKYIYLGDRSDGTNTASDYGYYHDGASTTINFSEPVFSPHYKWNVIGNNLIVVKSTANSSGKYEVCYCEPGSGTLRELGIECVTTGFVMSFNAEGTDLWIWLGANAGIAVIHDDLSFDVYPDILLSGLDNAVMFDSYFFAYGRLFYMPSESTMGKTNSKSHAGSLGYVDSTVAQGETGTAKILFR